MRALKNLLNQDDFQQLTQEANTNLPTRTIATRDSIRPNKSRQQLFSRMSKSPSVAEIQPKSPAQEKFVVKQYWRSLLRWQGFDDYMFLRDPLYLRHIKGKDTLTKSEVVEQLSNMHLSLLSQDGMQEYRDQHRRLQMQQLQKLYQPGEANYQKFNPEKYKLSFKTWDNQLRVHMLNQKVFDNVNLSTMIDNAVQLLNLISEKLINQEIYTIAPLGERLVRLLFKIGCLNLFLIGSFIHNCILELYGKEKVAYQNWKKILRICNMQGNHCHKFKLVAYKHISNTCLKLQQYDKSLIYLKKMLKLSWIIGDTNYELFTYDKISMCYYYKQDMNKAVYYHDKFAKGEYEEKGNGMRNVGEAAYLLDQKTREGFIDQNSYSEDDYDLDVLQQNGTLNKWVANKDKLTDIAKKIPMDYKKGHSFGKIHRPTNSVVDFKHAMFILHKFQAKQSILLGPIGQKKKDLQKKKELSQSQSCQYLFNQKSTNRVAQNFLIQEELKDQQGQESLCFKPSENVFYIKKMIKVFQYDIKYFLSERSLFKNSTD